MQLNISWTLHDIINLFKCICARNHISFFSSNTYTQ